MAQDHDVAQVSSNRLLPVQPLNEELLKLLDSETTFFFRLNAASIAFRCSGGRADFSPSAFPGMQILEVPGLSGEGAPDRTGRRMQAGRWSTLIRRPRTRVLNRHGRKLFAY